MRTWNFRAVAALTLLGLTVAGWQCLLAADAPKVVITPGTWKDVQTRIAAHKGKVVVVDAWATSCPSCVAEFPGLVKLHKLHGKDVACISVSCDYQGIKSKPAEFYRERVTKFLEKQGATFENYLSTQPAEAMYSSMGIASIPAVFVYGPDGKLVKRFDNDNAGTEEEGFTYKEITELVESLLK